MKTNPPFFSLLRIRIAVLLALAAACFAPMSSWATEQSWKSNAASTAWGTDSNWVSGTAPSNSTTTDTALFNQTSYNNQPNYGTTSIAGITVGDGTTNTAALTLTGTTLTLGTSGITINPNSGTVGLSGAVRLAGNQTWTNNSSSLFTVGATITNNSSASPVALTIAGTGNTTISGIISNNTATGQTSLTKDGTGTLILTGSSTYSGATTINAGTLSLGNANNFASPTTVNAGATVRYAPTAPTYISSTAATVNLQGAMVYNTAGNHYFVLGGAVTVNAPSTINLTAASSSSAGLYFDGGLKGSSNVTVTSNTNGLGLVLRNANSNYSGTLTVNGNASTVSGIGSGMAIGAGPVLSSANLAIYGTLELGNAAAGMGGAMTGVDGATLGINGLNGTGVVVGNMASTSTRTLSVGNNNGSGDFSGVIANGNNNTLGFTKNGSGTQTLSGNNTYTGTTTISAGTLTISGTGQLGGGSYAGAIANSGNFIYTSNASQTLSGVISGNGALMKNGTGTLTLTGMNTYSGATTINAGTLSLGNANNFASPTTVNAGATVRYAPTAPTSISSTAATVNLQGAMVYNTAGTSYLILGGAVTVNAPSTINLTAASSSSAGLYFDGGLKGSSNVTVTSNTNGLGLVLRNANSNYSGTLTVNGNASTVSGIGSGMAIGAGPVLSSANLAIYGTLELGDAGGAGMGWALTSVNGATLRINALNGTGVVVGNMASPSSTRTLSVGNNNGSGDFSGVIANGDNNTLGFTKNGSGTQTLSGNNTYTGATAVSAGILVFSNTAAKATGAVTAGASGSIGLGVGAASGDFSAANVQTLFNTGNLLVNTSNITLNATSGVALDTTAGNFTQSSALTAARALIKLGANTLTLNASNTYTGGTTISAGTLQIGAGSTTGSLSTSGAITNNGTLVFNRSDNISQGTDFSSAAISGSGSLVQAGTGTLTLNASNTYTGGTTINAGTLQIGAGSTTGSLNANSAIINNGTLAFNRTDTITQGTDFASTISGSGTIRQIGSGVTSLSGTNTNTGAVEATAGTLLFSGAGALSASTTSLNASNSATLSFADGTTRNSTIAGNINLSGSSFLKFDINGASSDFLSTTGIASLTGTGKIQLNLLNAPSSGTTYDLLYAVGGLTSNWTLDTSSFVAGAFTWSLSTSVPNTLQLVATASQTNTYWTGSTSGDWSTIANWSAGANGTDAGVVPTTGYNVFFDSTTPSGNLTTSLGGQDYTLSTLAISKPEVTINGSNTLNVTTSALTAITISATGNTTINANLAGVAGLTKTGTGTLTLGGSNTYTGGTLITGGTVVAGSSTAFGNSTGAVTLDPGTGNTITLQSGAASMAISNNFTLSSGTTAWDTNSNNTTLSGAISGVGALTKNGLGNLTLAGQNAYTGATTINAGTLQIGAGSTTGSLSTSSSIINNGTLAFNRTNTITQGTDFASVISGTGNLIQAGTGNLVLSGNNTYTGATMISAGTLEIASTGRLGGGSYAQNITNNGAFLYSGTNNQTLSGVISGTGALTHNTTGGNTTTLTLTGNNTYTGATTVSAGILNIQHANALGGSANGTTVASGAVLQLQGGITIASEALTLNGSGVGNGGALVNSSGNNEWAGNITIGSALTRIHANTGTTLTISGNITNNAGGALHFQGPTGANIIVSGIISGNGSLNTNTTGFPVSLTLSGNNTYTGKSIFNTGTISINSIKDVGAVASSLGAPTTTANGLIDIGHGTGGIVTLRYTGSGDSSNRTINLISTTANQTIDQSGTGTLRFTSNFTATGAGSKTLILQGSTAGIGEIAGAVVNNNSTNTTSLTKNGTGTWILSGANTYTGATTINAGTLQVGNGSSTGNLSASSTITNNGTLVFNRSGTVTQGTDFANGISGTGNLTQAGPGNLIINAANSYTGVTTVANGTLTLSGSGTLGTSTIRITGGTLDLGGSSITNTFSSITGGTISNGTLTNNGGNYAFQNGTVSASLAGTNGLTKTGSNTLTLTGSNSYSGATTISAGNLSISSASALLGTSGVNLADATALIYTGGSPATLDRDISVTGTTGSTGTIRNDSAGLLTLSGALTKNGTTLALQGGSGGITVSGSIVGSNANSDLIIDGGSVTLYAANTYNGPTTIINGGTLNANFANALPTANGRTAISIDATGSGNSTLALGVSQSIASLTGNTTSTVALSSNTLTINATSGSATYAGRITGSGALVKDGESTQVLTGNNTGFAGNTTVSGGTLQAAAAGAMGNSTVINVNGGSFLVTAENAVSDSTNINLGGGRMAVSGTFNENVGLLTLSADSVIDLNNFTGILRFGGVGSWAPSANLAIWNWNGTPLHNPGNLPPSGGTRHVVFASNSGLDPYLDRISFYSGSGSGFVGNAFEDSFSDPSFSGTEIIAVPEPETYLTGVILLLGGIIYLRRQAKHREGHRPAWPKFLLGSRETTPAHHPAPQAPKPHPARMSLNHE
jgi:autotransporter-associated beta strand protein